MKDNSNENKKFSNGCWSTLLKYLVSNNLFLLKKITFQKAVVRHRKAFDIFAMFLPHTQKH